ncbi:hypothetical protein GHT06_012194 [Daphnia sinensis]|uniref:Uncharacterized protein n=1 Tax=Daphnia sinensis TaxID=1820382 RepID=A0AAD5PWZ6_9CRUS|nr:hypothetical protein GHT06_012194 [Daphnia sinensis]
MVNWISSSAIGGLKRLLIGATLLPGKFSSRHSSVYYSRDSRDIWQVTINNTRRHSVSLASRSFWQPAVAPFHVPNRLSSFTVCKSKMVISVEAASVWETPNDHPILALHGWHDNASTFDNLIPLLLSDLYVVCLDFCVHGLSSSHYPKGMMYHYWDHIAHIHLVAEYFETKEGKQMRDCHDHLTGSTRAHLHNQRVPAKHFKSIRSTKCLTPFTFI